ncbi:MAG: hypothetical protein ACAH59_08270 [Pseudobdellovibrionaceae bacterium]
MKGFAQQKEKNQKYDQERLSGAGEIQKKREEWEKQRQEAVGPYKAWKSKQAEALDESSPEYHQDKKNKKAYDAHLEELRQKYVQERNLKRAQRKTNVKLTEEEEYGLNEKVVRVDVSKRALYGGKPGFMKSPVRGGGAGSGSGAGSMDFGSPPPPPSEPSMPPPPAPEFYEPEIPPPPPPEFEEPIPPPVFDDPEQ